MKLTEKTVEKRYVYRGRILQVRCDAAQLPDGRPCVREMVEHPGGAAVIAECEGRIAFVRQFRYPYGEEILEVPAGKLEKGEDPARTVERELSEETGLAAEKFVFVGEVYPTPGYTNERLYLYRAEGASRRRGISVRGVVHSRRGIGNGARRHNQGRKDRHTSPPRLRRRRDARVTRGRTRQTI